MHARGSRQIEKLSSKSQSRWIENLSRIYQPDKKFRQKEKGTQYIAICLKVSRSCRDVQKQFFKGKKNTDMNAIKHAIQPKIQTIF